MSHETGATSSRLGPEEMAEKCAWQRPGSLTLEEIRGYEEEIRDEETGKYHKEVIFAEYVSPALAEIVLTPSTWNQRGEKIYDDFCQILGWQPDSSEARYGFNYLVYQSMREYQHRTDHALNNLPREGSIDRTGEDRYIVREFKLDGKKVTHQAYLEQLTPGLEKRHKHAHQANIELLAQRLEKLSQELANPKMIEHAARVVINQMEINQYVPVMTPEIEKSIERTLSESKETGVWSWLLHAVIMRSEKVAK